MEIIEWWPKLDPHAKAWLSAHNGEALPAEVLRMIEEAGGSVTSGAWWVGESGPDGYFLSNEAVDWIEAVANDEPAD